MPREYAAFISYRHLPLDIAVAEKLHRSIERYVIPRDLRKNGQKHPGLVFRDREELPLSNNLTADIFEALDNANCLIVVCTPETQKSMWVRREISHFIEKHGRNRIITVLADGTPEESIPKEITTLYADDGVTVLEEYEPLVAYLTADSQRKVLKNLDKELLRLCAAILGCPYDSLRQRHKRRKMQQALTASAAAFLLALSFIGMLVNRNLEIAEQKRAVQLRESELLAADAAEAMLTGDTLRAIDSAVSALPKDGEEDRPYYAPAESVLMEAMDILGGAEEHVLLRDVVLEQMTPISHFDLSMDGSLAVTIDDYGVLHCFNTDSGAELWTDIMTTDSQYASAAGHVRISTDESCLVCQYNDKLEGRNLKNGELLWECNTGASATGYFLYDDNRNRIATLSSGYDAGDAAYHLELDLLSARTGIVEQTILLERSEETLYQTIQNSFQTRLPTGGAFSEDSRYFACAFCRDSDQEDSSLLVCFVADLQEGTVAASWQQEIPYDNFTVSKMEFREDGLLMALEVSDDAVAASLLKLDWQSSKLLWHTTTPAELEGYSFSNDLNSYILFWDTIAIAGRYEKLYAIDLATGELLNSVQLPGTLSAMYTVSTSYFGFSLEDGTYAIGWFSMTDGFSLSTEYFYQVSASIGEHLRMLPYMGGIVQRFTDGNYLEISISNVEREGYLAVVPYETQNQLVIKRPVTVPKATAATALSIPVEYDTIYCTESDPVFCSDNVLILGQLYGYDQDRNTHYFHIALDTQTHEVLQVWETDGTYGSQFFFLPDHSGYLLYDRTGKTTLIQDGQETVLTEKLDPDHPADWQIRVSSMVCTDSEYLTDGTVLTAHCDTNSLTILKNGVEETTVPLPDSHLHSDDMDPTLQRYVQAGRNGYVLTHFTPLLESLAVTDVAFYDSASGTWSQPKLTAPLSNTASYAFAHGAAQFAAVDTAHTIRIYDLQTGEETAAIPLQLPYSSVLHMDFLRNDSCLMVKTKDAQIVIYDIATGEILFQDQLDTTFTGKLTAWEDTATQRLYLLDSSQSGDTNTLCIDLRSWTVLARAKDVLCYVPQTGELYHTENSYGSDDSLHFFQVPGTEELVQLGQQLLSAQ